MRPRLEQKYTRDLSNGVPGLVTVRRGELPGRGAIFIFESDDEDGIHWFAPGFDTPGDKAFSNAAEIGTVITESDNPNHIVSVDREGSGGLLEVLINGDNDPVPLNESAARNNQRFLEELGDESIQSARERAFQVALRIHGIDPGE